MNVRGIVLPALLAPAASAPQAQERKWIGSGGASPLPPSPGAGPFPATPSFNDQTVRQVVRLSVGGSRSSPFPAVLPADDIREIAKQAK